MEGSRLVFATLLVEGPPIRVTAKGHPSLDHDGQGRTLWTVEMPQADLSALLGFLTSQGLKYQMHAQAQSAQSAPPHQECLTCTFYDQIGCGFKALDERTQAEMAATPDGQSSLGRCPENHTGR